MAIDVNGIRDPYLKGYEMAKQAEPNMFFWWHKSPYPEGFDDEKEFARGVVDRQGDYKRSPPSHYRQTEDEWRTWSR